jgi:hypothetical protein
VVTKEMLEGGGRQEQTESGSGCVGIWTEFGCWKTKHGQARTKGEQTNKTKKLER